MPPESPPRDPTAPPVSLLRDPMALPVSPSRDPAASPYLFLGIRWRFPYVLVGVRRHLRVSFSGPDGASRVSSSESCGASCFTSSGFDGSSCVSCLRSRDAGYCSSSSSCTSSCRAPIFPTYSSSPSFTPRSTSPTPSLSVLPGPLIHCTACRFAFTCKRDSQGPHWITVSILIASVVFDANASAAP